MHIDDYRRTVGCLLTLAVHPGRPSPSPSGVLFSLIDIAIVPSGKVNGNGMGPGSDGDGDWEGRGRGRGRVCDEVSGERGGSTLWKPPESLLTLLPATDPLLGRSSVPFSFAPRVFSCWSLDDVGSSPDVASLVMRDGRAGEAALDGGEGWPSHSTRL